MPTTQPNRVKDLFPVIRTHCDVCNRRVRRLSEPTPYDQAQRDLFWLTAHNASTPTLRAIVALLRHRTDRHERPDHYPKPKR